MTKVTYRQDGSVLVDDARLVFKNFAGREGPYNAEGDRNFALLLDPVDAEQLLRENWNVKHLSVREEGDEPQAYITVSVKYRGRSGAIVRPPTVVLIASRGRTALGEEQCEILDWVDIANVDLIIRPYSWSVNGKSGTKAYLKSIYITIQEDELQLRYADVPEIGPGRRPLAIEGRIDDAEIYEAEIIEDELPTRSGRVDD